MALATSDQSKAEKTSKCGTRVTAIAAATVGKNEVRLHTHELVNGIVFVDGGRYLAFE